VIDIGAGGQFAKYALVNQESARVFLRLALSLHALMDDNKDIDNIA